MAASSPEPSSGSDPPGLPSPEPQPAVGSGVPGIRAVLVPVGSPLVLLAVAALGTGLLVRFHAGESAEAKSFMGLFEFGLWSGLIGVSLALWIAVAAVAANALYERWRQPANHPGRAAFCVYGAGLLGVGLAVSTALGVLPPKADPWYPSPFPWDGAAWRFTVLVLLGQLAACPVIVGLWDTQARMAQMARRISGSGSAPDAAPADDSLRELHTLWKDAVKFLTCGLIIICMAVIDTGALRNALLAYAAQTPGVEVDFPASYVLLYGAFFSVMFAFVFVPVALQWRGLAHRLVESTSPIPAPGALTADWMDQRAALTSFLRLDLSLTQALSPTLGILAPFAASALSLVLPGG